MKLMTEKYTPGAMSHMYQGLSAVERSAVDREVDEKFALETGNTAKLDWSRAGDRPQARTWLRIRDKVMLKHYFDRLGPSPQTLTQLHEWHVEYEAEQSQNQLATVVEKMGLPELHEDPVWGEVLEISHLATEAFDILELADIWPLILGHHVAHAATLYVSGILAPFLNLLGGLYALGHANEAGQRGAERNAFKWGFAATIAESAVRRDWKPTLPRDTPWGHQQLRGRNAAIRMLELMGRDVGLKFLQRYVGSSGRARVLADMGGYE